MCLSLLSLTMSLHVVWKKATVTNQTAPQHLRLIICGMICVCGTCLVHTSNAQSGEFKGVCRNVPKRFLSCVSAFLWNGAFSSFSLTSWGTGCSQRAMKTEKENLRTYQKGTVVAVLAPNLSGLWMSCLHLGWTF